MGVVGCELNGPPPGVGGRANGSGECGGECGGEDGGAGIEVPSVKDSLVGVYVRKYELLPARGFS